MQSLSKTLLTLVLLCLLITQLAMAGSAKGVSKRQAISAAQVNFPGKVVKVSSNQKLYHIRVLQKNGRVVMVKVDKLTGKVLKSGKRGG